MAPARPRLGEFCDLYGATLKHKVQGGMEVTYCAAKAKLTKEDLRKKKDLLQEMNDKDNTGSRFTRMKHLFFLVVAVLESLFSPPVVFDSGECLKQCSGMLSGQG